jgi:hypothetical protein
MDMNMIGAFISGMTNEALVHELRHCKPRTTRELLDLATSHASGEKVVHAIFCKYKGKAQAKPADEAKDRNRQVKGKKDSWRRCDSEFVAAVDRVHKQKTRKLNHVSFDKIVKMQCHNHGYLVKHTLEECDLIKRYFSGDYKATGIDAPSEPASNEEKGDAYPDPKGCLMIFGEPMVYESKSRQKLMAREVNVVALGEAVLAFLKWSETAITFNRKDHPNHIPQPGRFPLIVDPIIGKTRLFRVLMDGGSGLNLLYAEEYNAMGLTQAAIQPSGAPFHGVIPGHQTVPLGQVDLPVTFEGRANFRMETLTFKIADFLGAYHAILGRPCYTKFIAIPNYTYLTLKMPGPHEIITIGGDLL